MCAKIIAELFPARPSTHHHPVNPINRLSISHTFRERTKVTRSPIFFPLLLLLSFSLFLSFVHLARRKLCFTNYYFMCWRWWSVLLCRSISGVDVKGHTDMIVTLAMAIVKSDAKCYLECD